MYRDHQGALGYLLYGQGSRLVAKENPCLLEEGTGVYPRTRASGELCLVHAIVEVERGPSDRVTSCAQMEISGVSGPAGRGSRPLPSIAPREGESASPHPLAPSAVERREQGLWEPRVSASFHAEDGRVEVEAFDATPWFASAADEQIRGLLEDDYSGCAADRVAEFAADYDEEVRMLYIYLEIVNRREVTCGSDCHVDPREALAWLTVHRPHLLSGTDSEGR